MARSITEIKKTMTDNWMANPEIIEKYNITPGNTFEQEFSLVSLENILFNTIAFAIFIFEGLLDIFKSDVETRIAATRVHNSEWYRGKALAFQYGFEIGESDTYDNTGIDDDVVAASKIIANAAVIRLNVNGYGIIRIKVVKKTGDVYTPLTTEELTAFRAYMNYVGDAGTTIVVTSGNPDLLKAEIDIYYDPRVLSATGAMLDGSNDTPVQSGISAYLLSQDFNGRLVRRHLENYIESIPGVIVPNITNLYTKYGNYEYDTEGVESVGVVNEMRVPDSGYLALDEAIINWIAEE